LGITRVLQAEGWQVDAVTDGEYALAATATEHYDAAVLDLGLPRRSGQDVLMSSHGTAVPKTRIISAMSSWGSNFSANSVEIYILKLRRVGYALETS
jgi:DNA-binding response OmpR family regulator